MITENLKPTLMKCLGITGSFEGASWGGVIGNFDGAGTSAFILQWNFLSTLSQLLFSMVEADITKFEELMGKERADVLIAAITSAHRDDIQSLIMHITTGKQFEVPAGNTRYFNGGEEISAEWKEAFKAVGEYFKDVQMQAAESYFNDAIAECKAFNLNTERSVVFMFDQCVQRGKHSLSDEQQAFLIAKKNPNFVEDDDKELKVILLHDDAEVPEAWRKDVYNRRICIMNDGGMVHGKDYNLGKEFGLTDEKVL